MSKTSKVIIAEKLFAEKLMLGWDRHKTMRYVRGRTGCHVLLSRALEIQKELTEAVDLWTKDQGCSILK